MTQTSIESQRAKVKRKGRGKLPRRTTSGAISNPERDRQESDHQAQKYSRIVTQTFIRFQRARVKIKGRGKLPRRTTFGALSNPERE